MSNSAELSGTLVEKKAKRFTPAGIPVLELLVSHQSQVTEAARPRTVQFELRVKALGDIAESIEQAPLGSVLQMKGFFAPARLHSRSLIFHLTNFELE